MTWNAALVVSYTTPIPDREATAMEVFAGAFTVFGTLAADGKCAEPEVFHHLIGGGMMIIKTESTEIAYEILELDDVRKIVDRLDFHVTAQDLRKTTITRLFTTDRWTPGEVQAFVGHSDPRMTLGVYTLIESQNLPQPSAVNMRST